MFITAVGNNINPLNKYLFFFLRIIFTISKIILTGRVEMQVNWARNEKMSQIGGFGDPGFAVSASIPYAKSITNSDMIEVIIKNIEK